MSAVTGRVAALMRFPVKSLGGEALDEVAVDVRGLAGDRLWSVRDPDGRLGSGKTSHRFRRMDGLLALHAAYAGDVPVIALPDGRVLRGPGPETDQALSEQVGRPVSLAREADVPHFDEGPVHLVSTASLRSLETSLGRPVDWRRSRANVLVEVEGDGFPEHDWVGATIEVGEVELHVREPMPRCVMVNAAQAGLPEDAGVLTCITGLTGGDLGVVADVVRGGRVTLKTDVRS